MEDMKERITTSISTAELERRWRAAREVMRERGIDVLLMRNDEEFLGSYVKWFTDIPARHSYPYTVIFPIDEEMTTIACGPPPPGEASPPRWAVRGVKNRLSAPYFPSLHYTHTYDAEVAAGVLRQRKGATVGLVGKSFIPMNFFDHLRNALSGTTFVDATEEIDRIKVIKSPEEMDLIRATAEMQDRAMQHVGQAIRPGLKEFEILAEANFFLTKEGSERGLVLVSSAKPVSTVRYQGRHFQNRTIREGDRVAVLLEVNGPGGFYTELGRMFCLAKPPQELQDAFATAKEAQDISLSMLKPGADPKEIWEANNAFLQKRGFSPERRLYAHGQGYDLVERPAIRYDEPMKIRANMNITVHPFAVSGRIWATLCDNFLVTETGKPLRIHKTPREIIVLT